MTVTTVELMKDLKKRGRNIMLHSSSLYYCTLYPFRQVHVLFSHGNGNDDDNDNDNENENKYSLLRKIKLSHYIILILAQK